MSIDAINRAIDLFPELTDFGFGTFDERRLSPKERAEKFLKNRELMYTARSIEQFQKACDWLNRQPRTKRINPEAGTSYGLKHVAAHSAGYVTNGMFIAAAIACGFEVQRAYDSPNAWFNISKRARKNAELHS
jgi:hypothetical protein